MKKTVFLMMLAVVAVCFTACKKAKGGAQKENGAENGIELSNSFDCGDNFSIKYPDMMTEDGSDERGFFTLINKHPKLEAVFHDDGNYADLNACADSIKQEKEEDFKGEYKFDNPVIKDNVMTLKSVIYGEVVCFFVVRKDAQKAVVGKYCYKETEADKHEKYFEPILKSIEIK